MLLMLAGLFVSRALLSISIIIFLVAALLAGNPKDQVKNFLSTPLYWGMSLLFLLPLVSGLWSEDHRNWMHIMRIKLPLFILPFSFAGMPVLDKKRWEWIAYVFIMLVIGAAGWSMYHYLVSMQDVHARYLQAATMRTPFENDHVRFSWVMSIAIMLSAWLWITKRKDSPAKGWALFFAMTWLVVFLHILAARTGLVSFYAMLALTGLWLIIKKTRWQYGLLLLLLVAALPVAAYYLFPSFQNRVTYVRYELTYSREGQYLPGSNDAVRVISLKAGWDLTKENAGTGVGYGDIRSASENWYDTHYPGMVKTDKIYPSNQWLMYGAACGIPGIIVFGFCMLVPFFMRTRYSLLWWMLNITAALTFMTDIGLEVQFGVFAWAFFILWWFKWFGADVT